MSQKHTIDCVVDTQPMADSIETVSANVKTTTAAVVTFQSAVIKAEKEGADHVCKNVNLGFFSLMHSQISQKIAAHQSRVDSLLMGLVAQKKRLIAVKTAMERNYEMIVGRYMRVITGLNKSLKQQVIALDRPIFNFATRDVACNFGRNQHLAATVPICQAENITASQQIAMSNMKYNSTKVIESTKDFLRQMNEQKIISEKILLRSIKSSEGVEHLPVAIIESQIDNRGNTAYEAFVPETTTSQNVKEINSRIYEMASDLNWVDSSTNDIVRQEFSKLVAASETSDRVREMTSALFENSQMQTL